MMTLPLCIQPEYDTFKKSGYKVYQTTKAPENTSVKIEVQSSVENNDAVGPTLQVGRTQRKGPAHRRRVFIGKEKINEKLNDKFDSQECNIEFAGSFKNTDTEKRPSTS